ncbi:MAG: sigma-70 family RNA polymerase sigma factor [Betaproteobacteria bacterium]|nr:MAG: sigma-70 family RNA polymerase sigma factor [Betaproteobacteria bacterium]
MSIDDSDLAITRRAEEPELKLTLVAIATGDQQAMIRFYKAFESRVYAFAMRRVGNAEEAEGVVVETMYEVWKAAKNFKGESKVETWLLGIAKYKSLDKLRARDLQTDDIEDYSETLADESPGTEQLVYAKERAHILADCIDELPKDQSEALHLVYFEGASVEEVSEVQAIPGGTVKTRLFHARKKLKDCLERNRVEV